MQFERSVECVRRICDVVSSLPPPTRPLAAARRVEAFLAVERLRERGIALRTDPDLMPAFVALRGATVSRFE